MPRGERERQEKNKPKAEKQLTSIGDHLMQLRQEFPRVRVLELGRAVAETAPGPFPIAVLTLEQADEEGEALIDAPAGVLGLGVGVLGRHLVQGDLGVGLQDDGALDLLEDHGEAEHDAEGGQPSGLLLAAGVQGLLLPVEDVVVDVAAQDAEEEFELTVR